MNENTILIEKNQIKLQGRLNFQSVPDIQKRIRKCFLSQSAWVVDLSGVSFSDSAGLALLTECIRLSKQYSIGLEFTAMPPQMLAMAKVIGLEKIILSGSR
jgi:phospholipid transport system transporter-binding protein